MVVLFYFMALIFLLIILILISPIRLTIDTRSNTYSIIWKGIIKVALVSVNEEPTISMKILVFKKEFNLLTSRTKKKTKKKVEKKKTRKTNKITLHKIKQLGKTFDIKTFYVNLDFDDYIVNGYLVPVFYFLKSQKRNININCLGRNEIQLVVENRPYKLIKAYLF